MAPNSTKIAGSGTRSRRRPSRSGFSSGFEADARRFVSVASRRSRIVRGASFFAGRPVAGAPGAGGAATLAFVFVVIAGRRWAGLVGLDRVAAELVAQRGEHLGPVGVVLAGAEPGQQRSVMTGAGTSWSIASWTVQRPRPSPRPSP